ncbi:WSC-domain-containing protein [Serendipita vermifera]|nr:WSC-domain-containing protein [Serendipita vermifera]
MGPSKFSTLISIITLLQSSNAFLFEPPSANLARRHGITTRDHHSVKVSGKVTGENDTLNARAPADWTNVGCFTDNGGARTFSGTSHSTDDMTNAKCQELCDADGYTIAATEWSRECFCDSQINNGGHAVDNSECTNMCAGDATEVCGGGLRLTGLGEEPIRTRGSQGLGTLWMLSTLPTPESFPLRFMSLLLSLPKDVWTHVYLKASTTLRIVDLELLGMLFIARTILTRIAYLPPTSASVMRSAMGIRLDIVEMLMLYENTSPIVSPGMSPVGDWNGMGCYTDSVAARTLPNQFNVEGDMTVEKCTNVCLENAFKYAGVEYGVECYCANEIGGTGQTANAGCNMPCSGDATQTCGGGNRINIYTYAGNDLPSGSTIKEAVGAWEYQDCYSDSIDIRTLSPRVWVDGSMTVEKCVNKCFEGGFMYAGLEYANECCCSNSIGGSSQPGQTGCSMPCEGDSSSICGGGNSLTLYKYTNTDLPAAATALNVYNQWTLQGCFVDTSGNTAMPHTVNLEAMTVGKCVDACIAAGYTVAGLEYSVECYCSNALPTSSANEGCSMACAGDTAHICGGGNRLSVYSLPAAPQNPENPETPETPEPEEPETPEPEEPETPEPEEPETPEPETPEPPTPPTPQIPPQVWSYVGCRRPNWYVPREYVELRGTLTPQVCMSRCEGLGFSVAALWSSSGCECDNIIPNGYQGTADCTVPCSGDPSQRCGSNIGYGVWTKPLNSPPLQAPTANDVYSLQGCYPMKGLFNIAINHDQESKNMKASDCIAACRAMGMPVAAVSRDSWYDPMAMGGYTKRAVRVIFRKWLSAFPVLLTRFNSRFAVRKISRYSCVSSGDSLGNVGCGDQMLDASTRQDDSKCNIDCADGSKCGGSKSFSVYLAGA